MGRRAIFKVDIGFYTQILFWRPTTVFGIHVFWGYREHLQPAAAVATGSE